MFENSSPAIHLRKIALVALIYLFIYFSCTVLVHDWIPKNRGDHILFEIHIGIRLMAKIDIRVHTDRPALFNFLLFVRMRQTSQTSVSNFSQKEEEIE